MMLAQAGGEAVQDVAGEAPCDSDKGWAISADVSFILEAMGAVCGLPPPLSPNPGLLPLAQHEVSMAQWIGPALMSGGV